LIDQDFLERLEIIFGSPACLNCSFLTANDRHHTCGGSNSGIDMEGWMEACAKLKACTHETINDLVLNSTTKLVLVLKSFLIKPAGN
jgi:hypothetical protein